MTANKQPIYTSVPDIGFVVIGAQNTKSDGTGTIGTDLWKAFTAGANGSYISKIRLNPTASVAASALAATVVRVFLSSQTSGATTTANTFLVGEYALGAQTADQTTTATFPIDIPMGFAIPANWTVLCSTHIVNNANTAWVAAVYGGDY